MLSGDNTIISVDSAGGRRKEFFYGGESVRRRRRRRLGSSGTRPRGGGVGGRTRSAVIGWRPSWIRGPGSGFEWRRRRPVAPAPVPDYEKPERIQYLHLHGTTPTAAAQSDTTPRVKNRARPRANSVFPFAVRTVFRALYRPRSFSTPELSPSPKARNPHPPRKRDPFLVKNKPANPPTLVRRKRPREPVARSGRSSNTILRLSSESSPDHRREV